ncbi:hypothetical protein AP75_00145 [Kaistella haifensis DSM 19056]|uniref:Secretion system C-terminal sorting domain-containing protein n=1 Tax=Kaistella haifensis DSM 19056 TaxID=1450526 RepID=A0A246BCI3_9FLAO|nr:T9SS type A sorting domain-containing protein [Kaistella haifensis]OWK99394.1 hypothetical protein AP75_00145 [Kaistella haifensis DSM 19056]
MKRKLLTAGMLALSFSATAQDLIYVGDASKFYVETGTLVYSGGNWVLDSNIEKTVENKGNIMIVGDYKKGTKANAASDGKEFVNVWTATNDYGQVQILSSKGITDALMTVQRPAAPTSYFGGSFPISFPFKDQVNYVMTAFGLPTTSFKGTCGIDVNCGPSRYDMTMHKWNNSKIQGDAVVSGANFKAGDYYFLNLRPAAGLQPYMTGVINYKGTPSPVAYASTGIASVIPSMTESAFSDLGYNDWKTKVNPYNEKYESYMGYVNSTNKYTGKNIYRFGNPYTSNLDLTAVDGINAWLRITNAGGNRTLKQATTDLLIKDFNITKRTPSYDVLWNPANGSTNVNADYYSAKFDGTNWVGNPEALYIRPLETFNLNFPLLDPTKLGSRIVHLDVNFTDFHKTFVYPAVVTDPIQIAPKNAVMAKTASVTHRSAQAVSAGNAANIALNSDGFYQAEVFLVKDNLVEAAPVYLVGTNYSDISANAAQSNNKLFLYGMNADGTANLQSQKSFSEFNSDTYIGKPLSLGLTGLTSGESYELRFNLYEGSIFTNVKDLTSGAFYIKDNKNNTVKQISADQSYNFTADSNAMAGRFDFYWKEVSVGGTGGTLATANSNTKGVTVIYKDGETRKVRFESIAPKANIQVYNMAGRLVDSMDNVSTSQDYTLRLSLNGVYLVRVSYANGDVRTVKTIY